MTPSPSEEKKDQVRDLIGRVSEEIGILWNDQTAMQKIRRCAPDRLDVFWSAWDLLDSRLALYVVGQIPWSEIQESEELITIPGARMLNSRSGEWEPLRCRIPRFDDGIDVMGVARTVLGLVTDLRMEYGSGE